MAAIFCSLINIRTLFGSMVFFDHSCSRKVRWKMRKMTLCKIHHSSWRSSSSNSEIKDWHTLTFRKTVCGKLHEFYNTALSS